MSISTAEIYQMLTEGPARPELTLDPAQAKRNFRVDYYVISPRGSRTRIQRGGNKNQIRNAQSEMAVYFYLKEKHPQCEIVIQRLEFY